MLSSSFLFCCRVRHWQISEKPVKKKDELSNSKDRLWMFIFTKTYQLFLSSNKIIGYLTFLNVCYQILLIKNSLCSFFSCDPWKKCFEEAIFFRCINIKLSYFNYEAMRFHFEHTSEDTNFLKIT